MSDYNADKNPSLNKIRTVVFNYNFVPLDTLKVDQHSTETEDKVYHIVRKIGSTNISFRVDPSQIQG